MKDFDIGTIERESFAFRFGVPGSGPRDVFRDFRFEIRV